MNRGYDNGAALIRVDTGVTNVVRKLAAITFGIAAIAFGIFVTDVCVSGCASTRAAAVSSSLVMFATYLVIILADSPDPRQVHAVHSCGWIVVSAIVLTYILLADPVHRAWPAYVAAVGSVSGIVAATIAIHAANVNVGNDGNVGALQSTPIWTRQMQYKSLSILCYWAALIILAWSLRFLTDERHHHRTARVVLVLMSLYPLVYLSDRDDARETMFAVLDVVTIVVFGALVMKG